MSFATESLGLPVQVRSCEPSQLTEAINMAVWAKRDYRDRSYSYALEQLAEQHAASGRQPGMMMVGTTRFENGQQLTTIYIRLPDPVLLVTYPDFVKIDEEKLPKVARLLYGDPGEFRKYFNKPPL